MATPRYVELETVRRAVNIRDGGDSHDDDLLWSAILAAEEQIDNWCGRVFSLDDSPSARVYRPLGEYLFVGDIGGVDGLVVEAGSGGQWSPLSLDSSFYIEPVPTGRPVTLLTAASAWPATAIRVTARWGWPDVPAVVRHAAQIQAIRLFKRKDSPEGNTGWDVTGSAVTVSRMDPDVTELLKRYMRTVSVA